VTGFAVPSAIFLSADAVLLAHADESIGIQRFGHEMVEAIHQTVGMAESQGIDYRSNICRTLPTNPSSEKGFWRKDIS